MKKIFLSLILFLVPVILLSQGISKLPIVQPPPPVEDNKTLPPPHEDEDTEEDEIEPPVEDNKTLPPPHSEERENVRIFLAYKMKERLKLTEEQTLKILEILKEGDEFRMQHREKMAQLRKRCYDLLKNEKATEADFRKMVEDMKKMRMEGEAKMDATENKLLSILSSRQQLEWLLFKKELQKGEHRGKRHNPHPQRKIGRN